MTIFFAMASCWLPGMARAGPDGPVISQSPLDFEFQPSRRSFSGEKNGGPSCGVPKGRQQVYDPEAGVFHIHFQPRDYSVSAFTVTKAAARFPKPVVFNLTGVPRYYGCLGVPLALSVDGKSYALEEGEVALGRVDKALFRVERKADRVTVEFTEKGQTLLKAGAAISFLVDNGW